MVELVYLHGNSLNVRNEVINYEELVSSSESEQIEARIRS